MFSRSHDLDYVCYQAGTENAREKRKYAYKKIRRGICVLHNVKLYFIIISLIQLNSKFYYVRDKRRNKWLFASLSGFAYYFRPSWLSQVIFASVAFYSFVFFIRTFFILWAFISISPVSDTRNKIRKNWDNCGINNCQCFLQEWRSQSWYYLNLYLFMLIWRKSTWLKSFIENCDLRYAHMYLI